MKKVRFIIIVICISFCFSCFSLEKQEQLPPSGMNTPNAESTDEQREQVLLVLSDWGEIYKVNKKDGDQEILLDVHVHWNENGCMLTYDNTVLGTTEQTEVSFGKSAEFTIQYIPVSSTYKALLCYDGDPIPAEWKDVICEKERKEQWQAEYGTYENYLNSRNADEEKEVIQKAFEAAGFDLTAANWYGMFLEAVWYNAVPFNIQSAKADMEKDGGYCLTVFDTDKNTIQIYGMSDDLIDLVYYNGTCCYGPRLG